MFFGMPIIAFDCEFNRYTTENMALYFRTVSELGSLLGTVTTEKATRVGANMKIIAQNRYTWKIVAKQYFELLQY